ncbi:MAG: S-adenosylmethionine--diacylglycerol 3-amino-3-carboxypropyl transferase [Crocinitomicaceae bacterium]|jgi:S-adenosylmethionine-diacylglycerol 3-amino-3-carboxypropyl transferase|nr:S-adenosylmethionine--diacylglycerol 3-amino-3-carboxypropyl transferase [Crocinitomicaceae bacterium]
MKAELKEKVSFDFIRYANCWEDADILLEALSDRKHTRILSVGSAGDNSFSLLTLNPEQVVAVDVSQPQLYLVELKKAAIQAFDRETCCAFLGFSACETRPELFERLRPLLKPETLDFWQKHLDPLNKGIIHEGKFERYFAYFAHKILPWIHNKKHVSELFRPKSAEEQKAFYEKTWNSWRWRLLFKIFFSKYVMGKYGRDPEFLNEVKVPVGTFIFGKAEQQLSSAAAQNNFILRYNLTGSFGDLLPHYLRAENYDLIKQNIHKLDIFCGYAQDAASVYGTFSGMNLSNIFEYMPPELFRKTAEELVAMLETNGKIAYWNLMVPRRISEILPEKMQYEEQKSQALSAKDQGFFYNKFIVEHKI